MKKNNEKKLDQIKRKKKKETKAANIEDLEIKEEFAGSEQKEKKEN